MQRNKKKEKKKKKEACLRGSGASGFDSEASQGDTGKDEDVRARFCSIFFFG